MALALTQWKFQVKVKREARSVQTLLRLSSPSSHLPAGLLLTTHVGRLASFRCTWWFGFALLTLPATNLIISAAHDPPR